MQIPRRKSEELKKRDSGPFPITEEGLLRLRAKLARLWRAMPDLITEAQRTAAYGDRSDNAEYKEAKSGLRRTHWQILSIEDQIKRAEVITTGKNAGGTIQLGSTVTLGVVPASEKKQKTFQIVGPHETDPTKGRISHKSPLGAALIGHKKGDVIVIKTEGGTREYKILEIK
jgi:transcription elongation factor GreA